MPHWMPHSTIMYLIDAIIFLILVAVVLRTVVAVRGRTRVTREFIGNEPAFVTSDDDTLTKFREMNAERRRDSREHDTMTIAELAAQPGALATLEDEDVVTGTIVAVVPDQEPEPARVRLTEDPRVQDVLSVLDEIENEWNTRSGSWEPPSSLVHSLPEGDWLRELLVAA